MAGIYGRLDLARAIAPLDADRAALEAVRHRGPDDEGLWYGSRACLGVRRASGNRVSTGHQPALNEDASVAVVFNGQIYNSEDLRQELLGRGHRFATSADPEVIVHGWEEWGEEIASRLNGTFAFAVWDEPRRLLWIVRDRVGIKPLYYRHEPGRRLLFASEIKSILAHQDVPRSVDEKGFANFMAYGHAVAPETMYRGIRKLLPGHALRVERERLSEYAWWQVLPREVEGVSEADWARQLRELLDDSVRRQMSAEVPVGAFLGAGVDSAAVVALMTRYSSQRVKTFSIAFESGGSDREVTRATRVAAHLGTDHHEMRVKPAQLIDVLQTCVYHFDEPFGDAACFPAYLVSKLAREHVTAVVTGEGGDALFDGYERYRADRWLQMLSPIVSRGRSVIGPLTSALPQLRGVKKLMEASAVADAASRYSMLFRVFSDDLLAGIADARLAGAIRAYDAAAVYRNHMADARGAPHMSQLMYADIKTWLADTYLEKLDKTSMAASLEARVPLLDHRLVELSLKMPQQFKTSSSEARRIFRRSVADLLPREMLRKTRQGSAPTDSWFRGELRQFAYDVLLDRRTRQRGYFKPEVVERMWTEHQSGRQVRDSHLWLLLNFELWARRFLDARAAIAA